MNEPCESERAVALPSGHARDRSFHFTSPTRELSTHDAGTPLRFESRRDAADEAMRALSLRARQSREHALIAGALAFDEARPPLLRLHTVSRHQRTTDAAAASANGARALATARNSDVLVAPPTKVSMQPTPADYMKAVAHAVARIRAGALQKVVLARALDLELRLPLELDALRRRLAAQNPGKYVFSCDLSGSERERRTILGASPELLVAKHGLDVLSHPLAGSLPRSADAAEDRARAARLAESPKNLHEHALVVEAVADALAPYCRELHVPRHPALVQTATMWHLGTKVSGRLHDSGVSSLALALALHPTPAVCGQPRTRAASTIAELEGFDRGYFAGSVGYCDARGDGEWAVTIRCAEVTTRALRLYAGAGIVADSSPEDELAETSAKLGTLLRALGFEQLIEGA